VAKTKCEIVVSHTIETLVIKKILIFGALETACLRGVSTREELTTMAGKSGISGPPGNHNATSRAYRTETCHQRLVNRLIDKRTVTGRALAQWRADLIADLARGERHLIKLAQAFDHSISLVKGLAEREGFEPPVRFPVHLISSQAPSTARPPLPNFGLAIARSQTGKKLG
jgi:hypothetical protein